MQDKFVGVGRSSANAAMKVGEAARLGSRIKGNEEERKVTRGG